MFNIFCLVTGTILASVCELPKTEMSTTSWRSNERGSTTVQKPAATTRHAGHNANMCESLCRSVSIDTGMCWGKMLEIGLNMC